MDFKHFEITLFLILVSAYLLSILGNKFYPFSIDRDIFITLSCLFLVILPVSWFGSFTLTKKAIKKYGLEVEDNPIARKHFETGNFKIDYLAFGLLMLMESLLVFLLSFKSSLWDLLFLLTLPSCFLYNFLRELIIAILYEII